MELYGSGFADDNIFAKANDGKVYWPKASEGGTKAVFTIPANDVIKLAQEENFPCLEYFTNNKGTERYTEKGESLDFKTRITSDGSLERDSGYSSSGSTISNVLAGFFCWERRAFGLQHEVVVKQ